MTKALNHQKSEVTDIEKTLDVALDELLLNWKYKDVKKVLRYDIKKCIGCSLCKLVCPVDAIELGPIPEIAQNILDGTNPKLLIDHEKCCYCLLCVIVCPTDAFHENIKPEGYISLDEFPSLDKFYKIDFDKCIEDKNNEVCLLCLNVRERNQIQEYYKISKECPANSFSINSPITGEVIIKKNMLHKCDPQGCKACVNICPVQAFFIPESAEDVIKYGKIACNEEECFYCGACENSCPDDLIKVNRKDIKILNPKRKGNYPWIDSWIKSIKKIIRETLIEGKEQIAIPTVEEYIERIRKEEYLEVPQLSEVDKKIFNELNEKIQKLLKSSKIRYWIKDKKSDKIVKELRKYLS
ncbi:MAG: 4Fe-4S binding protein [Candidatus Thorarchaeota archaeon]